MRNKLNLLIYTSILIASTNSFANHNNLLPQKEENGKWGLIDESGAFVVKPIFSAIEKADGRYFTVAVGGKEKDGVLIDEKWGVIDDSGKFILNAEYDELGEFSNGFANIVSKGKIGFVNANWQIVIKPKYDYTGIPNKQGYVWVNEGGKIDKSHPEQIINGKFGVIRMTGDIIIPVQYASIGVITETKYHYDQQLIYNAKTELDRLMLESGSQHALWPKQIEYKIGCALPESIGFAFSKSPNLQRNGIIDTLGNILIKNDLYQRCAMPSDGLSLVTTKKNEIGFHDIESGELITNKLIRTAFSFDNGVVIGIDSNNLWHFFDKNLKNKGEAYNWISPRFNDLYLVRSGDEMKILNASDFSVKVDGKHFIFPPKNGLIAFKNKESGTWGFMNDRQFETTTPEYEYAYSFNHGYGYVKSSKGWGVVNSDAMEIITPQWSDIVFPTSDNFSKIWVKNNSTWECLDLRTDNFAFSGTFDEVRNFEIVNGNEYATVKVGDFCGCINDKGIFVIPTEYPNYDIAKNALQYKLSRNIDEWTMIHSYRFALTQNPKRNKFNINDTIPSEMWDY